MPARCIHLVAIATMQLEQTNQPFMHSCWLQATPAGDWLQTINQRVLQHTAEEGGQQSWAGTCGTAGAFSGVGRLATGCLNRRATACAHSAAVEKSRANCGLAKQLIDHLPQHSSTIATHMHMLRASPTFC